LELPLKIDLIGECVDLIYFLTDDRWTQLSILNHQIRNPLAVIVGLVDLEDMDVSDKILEQTEEIDKTISRLDKGWLESAKIQEFLRKHYDVGDYEGNDDE